MSESTLLTAAVPDRAVWQKATFSSALLAVTVLPLLATSIYSMAPRLPGVMPAIVVMYIVAVTHIFSTSYLLTDTAVLRFIAFHPVKMGLVPLFMVIGGTLILSQPGSAFFVSAVLAFYLYQTWHFGAQNIGVATFISLAERGKPLSAGEKNLIRLGVVCSMMGILRAIAPDFIVGEGYMPVAPLATALLELSYIAGRIAACGLAAAALVLLIGAWRQQFFMYGLALLLSVTFQFPMYLSHDRMISFLSFGIAHGLQYMLILFWHSLGRPMAKRVRSPLRTGYLAAPLALLSLAVISRFVWSYSSALSSDRFPLIGLAFLMSLTLAHFWVDQFLWRMKDKERAQWVRARYAFIFAH